MKISEIYDKYKIMPKLREHQLRVAAVAKIIANKFEGNLNEDCILAACLLHDMGNILKFNLKVFPESLQPEGLEYWEKVRADLESKYQTTDEHVATRKIAEELSVSEGVLDCLDSIGFSKASQTLENGSMEEKICCYADQRVDPSGIVSLDQRMEEGGKRYGKDSHSSQDYEFFRKTVESLKQMEREIFLHTQISLEDITDSFAENTIEELKEYSI